MPAWKLVTASKKGREEEQESRKLDGKATGRKGRKKGNAVAAWEKFVVQNDKAEDNYDNAVHFLFFVSTCFISTSRLKSSKN